MVSEPTPRPCAPAISVVIPAFNSAEWLPSTIAALREAILRASAQFEVIIVDDGSTDGTQEVTSGIVASHPELDIRVIRQNNLGRFIARYNGAVAARHPLLMLLDSRMLVDPDALRYLTERISEGDAGYEWNCHVTTDPAAPLVGRFWEVPVILFWSEYLARPRAMLITAENFDRVPKGTGGLVLRTELFLEACRVSWPQGDAHLVSDDTKILRHVVATSPLVLDPGYSAVYRPRINLAAFLSHAYDRGSLFVDSYAGTTRVRSLILIALAILPVAAIVVLGIVIATAPAAAPLLIAVMALALALPALPASMLGVSRRSVASWLVHVVPFGLWFWAGLLRGLRAHRHLIINGART